MLNPNENWVTLYHEAMLEFEHARINGRIGAARVAIVARVDALLTIPGLHAEESLALTDALSCLRTIALEEEQYDTEQKRAAIERAQQTLRSIEPVIAKLQIQQSPEWS